MKQFRTNIKRSGLKFPLSLIVTLLISPVASADGVDLHALWDSRCAQCHGHAGEFSRKFLTVSESRLQGRHHVDDLLKFMHNHYLSESEVGAVYNMLLAQTSTPPRFSKECSQCHGTAANLVRNSIELRYGVIFSRKSGHPIRNFLNKHMGLSADDVEFYDQLLTRLAQEIYRP